MAGKVESFMFGSTNVLEDTHSLPPAYSTCNHLCNIATFDLMSMQIYVNIVFDLDPSHSADYQLFLQENTGKIHCKH